MKFLAEFEYYKMFLYLITDYFKLLAIYDTIW